jgi:hypothetical protein
MDSVWNLGVKVRDLESELQFLTACGATKVERGEIVTPEGVEPFGMAFLGNQRLLLFPKVIYENSLSEPLKLGLAHAVYEVANLAEILDSFGKNGIRPFWGPVDLATPFGRRRIVFFRSPSGFVFETFQHLP